MPVIESLVVYDSVLFERGHMIRRWAEGVERAFTMHAIAEAPVNKRAQKSRKSPYPVGALKASIHGDVDKVGPKILQTTISADVPYASYVVNGTEDGIRPKSKPYMTLPKNGFRRQRHKVVSGQAPNNFLMRAASATARTHPSLRGFGDQVFKQW